MRDKLIDIILAAQGFPKYSEYPAVYESVMESHGEAAGKIADALIAAGVHEWVSVEERLPEQPENVIDEDGKEWFTVSDRYLVCNADGRVFEATYVYMNKEFSYRDSLHPVSVTHWMKLPAPPKEE